MNKDQVLIKEYYLMDTAGRCYSEEKFNTYYVNNATKYTFHDAKQLQDSFTRSGQVVYVECIR